MFYEHLWSLAIGFVQRIKENVKNVKRKEKTANLWLFTEEFAEKGW